jgi:RNA polymerase sigma-70 factor (ECF subfamily)
METLPDTYRIPLELSETENLSQYEIAKQLNISYSGARSRVQRARNMLRKKFEALYFIKSDAYGNIIVCENRVPCSCSIENC